jgi:hypothetical protein
MGSAQAAPTADALEEIWRQLLGLLEEAVRDLDAAIGGIFASFRSILQIAMDVARDRRAILASTRQTAAIGS